MPIWLIMSWHYPLTKALELPQGELNLLLAFCVIAAFFPFFWEDYYTLQKFVRGFVVVYYVSLALMLLWPESAGVYVALLSFVVMFSLWYRIVYRWATVAILLTAIAIGIYLRPPGWGVLIFVALAAFALGYIQTFITAAYDIRRTSETDQKD